MQISKILGLLCAIVLLAMPAQSEVIIQYFETEWDEIYERLPELGEIGFEGIWHPSPAKSPVAGVFPNGFGGNVGYNLYDRFDIGDTPQRGTLRTRYGTRGSLRNMVDNAHQSGIKIYPDIVFNHTGNGPHIDTYPGMRYYDFHGFDDASQPYGFRRAQRMNDFDPNDGYCDQNFQQELVSLFDIQNEPDRRFSSAVNHCGANMVNPGNYVRQPGQYERYPFHNPGDALPNEYPYDFLLRWINWLGYAMDYDGVRLDAPKHVVREFFGEPGVGFNHEIQWNFDDRRGNSDGNEYDQMYQNDIRRDDALIFGEMFIFSTGEIDYWRKWNGGDGPNNGSGVKMRYLDFPLLKQMMQGAFNGGNMAALSGFGAFGDQEGMTFVHSHDEDSIGKKELAYAYALTHVGIPIVFFTGNNYDGADRNVRSWMLQGYENALNDWGNSVIPNLVYVHNQFARGREFKRWDDNDVYVFERYDDLNSNLNPESPEGLVLVGLNDSGGDQFRTVSVAFPNGTRLKDYTGNNGDILEVSGGQVNLKIPGMGGQGFVCYAPYNASAQGEPIRISSETNMNWNVPGGRLASDKARTVSRLTASNVSIDVHFNNPAPPFAAGTGDSVNNVIVKWGQDEVVNTNATYLSGQDKVSGGFQQASFVAAGHWRLDADLSNVAEGLHVIQARLFNGRSDGGPALYQTFRKVVYVDLEGPEMLPENLNEGETIYGDRVIEITNPDKTAGWIEARIDGGAWQTTHEIMKGLWRFTIQGLSEGAHTIEFKAHEYDHASSTTEINSRTITRNFTVVRQGGWNLTLNHAEGSTQYVPFFETSGAKDSGRNIKLFWDGYEMDFITTNSTSWSQTFSGAYRSGGQSEQLYGAFVNGAHFFEAVMDDGGGNYQVVARTVYFNLYGKADDAIGWNLAYDSDGDGIPDDVEVVNFTDGSNPGPNQPLPGDNNLDLIPNYGENWSRMNPMNHDSTYNGVWDGDEDWDNDGFNNLCEVTQGYLEHGDPAFYNIYDGNSKPSTCDSAAPVDSQVSFSPAAPVVCDGNSVTINYVANEGILSNSTPIEVGISTNGSFAGYWIMSNNGGTWQYAYNLNSNLTSMAVWFRDQATGSIFDNVGGANYPVALSPCVTSGTCWNMDGVVDSANYEIADSGMKIWTALKGDCLYVATWSAHNVDATAADHFLFVTDEPGDAEPSPWGKAGMVKFNISSKPLVVAESANFPSGYHALDNGGSNGGVAMGNNGEVLEAEFNVLEVFGYRPTNLYMAAVAYGDADGGAILSQVPTAWDPDDNLNVTELLPVCLESIRDEDQDGYFDVGRPYMETIVNGATNDANYGLHRFIVNELSGDNYDLIVNVYPNVDPSDTITEVELISNLNRRDFAVIEEDLNSVTDTSASSYSRAYNMNNAGAGKYSYTLNANKCGAYRINARYRLNGNSEWHYYTDSCVRRDCAVVVSPNTVLDTTMYEVNPSIIEATNSTFAGRSTFRDIHMANVDRPDVVNVAHFQALGVNMLWMQPIHPIGIDGRDDDPLTNAPWDPGSPYAVRDYWQVNPILSANNSASGAMSEFVTMVNALDAGGIGVMMDGTFNHSAPDCVMGQGALDLFPWATNATQEIRLERPEWFSRTDDLAQHATFYNSASQNDIALAPDRIDFGKWTDVREFYFGAYDYLVRNGTLGDWNSKNFNAFQSERDAFFGHDSFSRETWEYFAYYPTYWLEKTGHPDGTPKAQSHKGIDGLRCDFAQGLPSQFWEYCINKTRTVKWNFLFMAESLDGFRTINGDPHHGVGYRSSRHFDILNENMVFAWRDKFFNYKVNSGGGEGASANPSTSLLFDEFSQRREAFDSSPILLNLSSHDEVFPSDNPYRLLYAYSIMSAMDGVPMLMYGQEAGAKNDFAAYPSVGNANNNWSNYESNFGKSIPNFKRFNDMTSVWSNRDWTLQSLYDRVGQARASSKALRSRNNYFLSKKAGGGYNERIFAVAKFEEAGIPVEQQDVVLVFVNNDYDESASRSETFDLSAEISPGINWFGINPVQSYNIQNLLSTNPTANVWASNRSGLNLINNGISVFLNEPAASLGQAQYLRLVNQTVPESDNDNDGETDYSDDDDDNDDLPDWWEIQYGLDKNDATGDNGKNGDWDNDGLTNYEEFLAGTDPKAAGSTLITHIELETNGTVRVSWDSVPGKNYRLQRSELLQASGTVWSDVFFGTALDIETFIMQNPLPVDEHFTYRVVLIP